MSGPIALHYDDPTIFAKCGGSCSKMGRGSVTARIFYRAYPRRDWEHGQVCENCKSPMVILYELQETPKPKRKSR